MKEELEQELVKKYPKILRDYGGDMRVTCMHWGIDTDSGWFDLVNRCMEELQYFCDVCSKNRQGAGVQVIATQIKEKYGSLRFYYTIEGGNVIEGRIIDSIIQEAERKSQYICEISGNPGESCVRGGWYKTLCYKEARKLGYRAVDDGVEEYWQQKDLKAGQGTRGPESMEG